MTDATLRPFPDDWDRAVVVAAHPDDIEWGAAAVVAAWTGAGIRRVAIAASHTPTHAIDVSGQVEQAVASLAAHARYLEVLQSEPPEVYARSVVGGMTSVAFEVLGGD